MHPDSVATAGTAYLSALNNMKALRALAFSVSRIITPAFEYSSRSSNLVSLTRMSTSPVI